MNGICTSEESSALPALYREQPRMTCVYLQIILAPYKQNLLLYFALLKLFQAASGLLRRDAALTPLPKLLSLWSRRRFRSLLLLLRECSLMGSLVESGDFIVKPSRPS